MKLTDLLNEAGDQWQVKDIIEMQKAHERILRATSALQKAVTNLEKISKKNRSKPNGQVFNSEANDMSRNFERAIDPSGRFWKNWEEYKKAGQAAFPNNWN